MTMSFLSCSCLCVVDFLPIFQNLNPQKKAALEAQCRDWKVFCSISHPHRWELVVDNLIKSVGGSLATDLDNLWKQLHPSQSTGLSHSMHSTSYIYGSASPDNDNIMITVIMHRINLLSCLTDYV